MSKIKEAPRLHQQAEIVVKGEKRYLKTPKGTELPLLQLRGRDYLQVAHRLVWFREEHPDWQIITKPLEINIDKKYAIFRSSIVNTDGKALATATKGESIAGFNDYIEKAETSATGRALALCGFGTQFAPELDEGERLADMPIETPKKSLPVVNSSALLREKGKIPTTIVKHEVDSDEEREECKNCSSTQMTIALTKPDNPRNPNRPYWKCLHCPPEKSFSHWVAEADSAKTKANTVPAHNPKSNSDPALPLE